LASVVVGDECEEFREKEAIGLEEGGAGNPVGLRFEVRGSRFEGCDRVVEAGAAPGGAGAWNFGAAAALGGERGEKRDACTGELGDASEEGFAEGGEGGGELLGEGSAGGAEVEGELETPLVGGGEEFELVGCDAGVAEPERGVGVEKVEERFGGAPEDGRGDGALGDGEEGWLLVGEVAGAELAVDFAKGEADAVAVGERRGWVELEFGESEAGGFEQRVKLSGFIAELRGVGEVLKLASAAGAEVRAGWERGLGFEVQGSRAWHIRAGLRGACRRG